MGFFSNYKNIGRINTLITQLEPKLDYIAHEINYPVSANVVRLKSECMTVAVLMNEILEIMSHSGRSVILAPYYLHDQKCNIQDICMYASALIEKAERIM